MFRPPYWRWRGPQSAAIAALSVAAASPIDGTGSATLGAITGTGAGSVDVAGTGSGTLGAITGTSAGSVAVTGSGSATLGAITGTGSSQRHSLRFYGYRSNAENRVRIELDNPANPPIDVGAGSFTVEFWVLCSSSDVTVTTNDVRYTHIIVDHDVWGEPEGWCIGLRSVSSQARVCFGSADDSWITITGGTNVGDSAWHHVAVTRNQSTGAVTIWVDGASDATRTYPTSDWSYPDALRPSSGANNQYLVLGGEKHGTENFADSEAFTGYLDELRVSDNVRYTTSFSRPALPFTPDANTVGLFSFDRGTGTVARDSSQQSESVIEHGELLVGGSPSSPAWATDSPFDGGVGNATLGAITGSGAGTVDIAGAGSATLGAVTGASAGAVDITGAGSATLGAIAGTSAGTVPITGSGSATLDAVTGTSAGTVAVAGTGSAALGAIAGTSAGTVDITGAGAATLGAVTGAAVGTVDITGTGAATLGAITGSGSDGGATTGAGSATLDAITGTAAGTVDIAGAGSATLGAITGSSAGAVDITGAGSATLDAITGAAAGTIDITGAGSATLGAITGSGSDGGSVTGTGAATLGAITGSGAGTVDITGAGSATLGLITCSAVGEVSITGSAAITLAAIICVAAGAVAITGAGSATLGAITGSGSEAAPTIDYIDWTPRARRDTWTPRTRRDTWTPRSRP